MWPEPAQNDANIKWVRDYYDATAPLSESGGYVNFMAGDDQDRIKANYKGNYDRLVEVKRAYDPDNLPVPEERRWIAEIWHGQQLTPLIADSWAIRPGTV